jgi:hypothetical protein
MTSRVAVGPKADVGSPSQIETKRTQSKPIEATQKRDWPAENEEMCHFVPSRRRRNEPIAARHDNRAAFH